MERQNTFKTIRKKDGQHRKERAKGMTGKTRTRTGKTTGNIRAGPSARPRPQLMMTREAHLRSGKRPGILGTTTRSRGKRRLGRIGASQRKMNGPRKLKQRRAGSDAQMRSEFLNG